jgi:hypothetical protein
MNYEAVLFYKQQNTGNGKQSDSAEEEGASASPVKSDNVQVSNQKGVLLYFRGRFRILGKRDTSNYKFTVNFSILFSKFQNFTPNFKDFFKKEGVHATPWICACI